MKLDLLMDDMDSIKESIHSIFSLTKDSKIPMGLKKVMKETFKCAICMATPCRPPLIVTKCCKRLLGCESCANTWFCGEEAPSKSCPLCKAERAYTETMLLRGFDDLLKELSKVDLE